MLDCKVGKEEQVDKLTFLEKELISFGDKWIKAENEWDIEKSYRRKRELMKRFIKRVFYGGKNAY